VTAGDKEPVADKPASAKSTKPSVHAAKTQGRALALQLVYSWEQNHYQDDGSLLGDEGAAETDDTGKAFAKDLFAGIVAERAAVDAAVDKRLENWTISRLAVVDRALLRLGAYELLYRGDTPPKVAINEYIELAKTYGSEAKTTKLVNGVLDRIAREHRGDEVEKKPVSGK